MFEDATFDSRSVQRSQAPRWMLLTLTINLGVVAAMIVLPLMYPASLPTQLLQRALYVPAPPIMQQPTAQQTSSAQASPVHDIYRIPMNIPSRISREAIGAPPAPTDFSLGMGISIGDGVPGASGEIFPPSAAPVLRQPQPSFARVTSKVLEGLLISKTTPVYPTLARTAGISGTVVLAATISKEGTIANLRVLSGHPMLTQAAVEAVKTWRYRPYLLNGQPIEVETTINVVFSMAGR